MLPHFDHERTQVFQKTVGFVVWVDRVIEGLPAKLAVRDQADRASTSIMINPSEGTGKRSHPNLRRYSEMGRGSEVECADCLDLPVARQTVAQAVADEERATLLEVVSMTAAWPVRFTGAVNEEQAPYGELEPSGENV